ncbi:Sulfate-transporting ATPase [Tepidanaerobacter acetatoxydans Re1]|uniref:Sulfate-transporting ATPase n=1 Tax=Tepidanaerobacter acetatoxydans (strain DSM 21804 / JCM 16047 / Re1) TaxID=1209989 RepID=F4LVY4_TEPAE|nr:ATP-binding cassette domain-containing protein [Tepidanaerobacter acetatoxydans]AEE91652.1 Sulfate-transporting ATPase [Tepidanaerobacter acetatoxydans Re1]CCP26394.1 Sulfate-transporting ATPase [Tepidanaerobacter acetatoxydans Re1]
MLKLESVYLHLKNGHEDFSILEDINLELENNKFYALTGPNGGGKTSLAKVIMGIYKNDKGRLIFDGEDITNLSITERAKVGISYAFQNPPRFKGMKIKDLLKISADESSLRAMLRAVGLCPQDYLDRECDASLSGGEMKRIELATVLARPSKLVIYDEPEAGVDLWSFENLLQLIRNYHKKGNVTSVVITHHERVLSLADEIILLADGKIAERGSKDKILPLIQKDSRCCWQANCGGNDNEIECY